MKKAHVVYEEQHGGLVLHSTVAFSNMKVKMHLTFPACMMPSFWVRHGLSAAEVTQLLNLMSTRDVWLLAIATGVCEPTHACLKMAFQSLDSVGIVGKATVLRKLLKRFQPTLVENPQNVLDLAQQPMVRHYLCGSDMDTLREHMLSRLTLFETVTISGLFDFLDQQWIAVSFSGDLIHAVCVVSEEQFRHRQAVQVMSFHAPKVLFRNHVHYLLLQDSILFCPGFVRKNKREEQKETMGHLKKKPHSIHHE